MFIRFLLGLFLIQQCTSTESRDTDINPENKRLFTIDYENNCFLKDGKSFQYVSGSIHYFRTLEESWDSLLQKMRLGGLNTITIYVEWSSHQLKPLQFNFDKNLNLAKFLQLAQKNDLLVIFRPSPFIDAERDMGGLPAWLLWKYPGIKLRSSDPDFKTAVAEWYNVLFPIIKPYLYENGGPIIMIQVENEYGSGAIGCDEDYKTWLSDTIRNHVGSNVVLFTNDSPSEQSLKCGQIAGVLQTLDFGFETDVDAAFQLLRKFLPKGPLVNSEYYSGWIDYWGRPHSTRTPEIMIPHLEYMISKGINVNIYMYFGGTSFGFGGGANINGDVFYSNPTSYDYDAPLSEAGDPTVKWFAIKNMISKYMTVPEGNATILPKGNYGKLVLTPLVALLDKAILNQFVPVPVKSLVPQTFEQLEVSHGFVLYETVVSFATSDPVQLTVPDFHDRGYVFVNEKIVGILSRTENISSIPVFIKKGQKLQILVESLGRPSWGPTVGENKGIGSPVQLGSQTLGDWTIYPLRELDHSAILEVAESLNSKENLKFRKAAMTFTATFTVGTKASPMPMDTFIHLDHWRKGMIWINGYNIGRYWPVMGPQQTLYLPAPLLKPYPEPNYLLLLELEAVPSKCLQEEKSNFKSEIPNSECFIEFTNTHILDGPTPYKQ